MPSLGNQYIALGGSLPELSLTSLTRLLPNSSANDAASATQHGLFTLVHHPTPLYVYSSQQHLATPFINPNGSITFGSFLSAGSSLCNPAKNSSADNDKAETSEEGASDDKSQTSEVKAEKRGGECVTNASLQTSTGSVLSSAANYSPITAHMIQPSTHATLNRAVPVMALPAFGTICNVNTQLGSSPPHPSIIPHITPYSSLVTTCTSSPPTVHPSCIVATSTSLDISSEAPSSHHSPKISSTTSGHASLSPMHTTSTIDNKEGVLRQIGVPPPSDLYLGGPSMNGMHAHTKLEGDSALTPTSEERQIPQGGVKHEKDRPYKCDHPGCERSFSFPAHLRSHIQQIHISYRPCKCEFPGCGKRFYTPQHLNVHRRVHTGERPFVCPYADCAKAFTTAGNLKNHIRTHTGERPYACKFEGCTKRFAEMSSLKKHELTHTGEKPYKCRVCGKAFSQAGSRNTHERKHSRTEGEETSSDGKVGRRYRIKRVPAASSFESDQN